MPQGPRRAAGGRPGLRRTADRLPRFPLQMREAIAKDKKADGGSVHFVLINDIGKVEVRLLPVDRIIQLLEMANI